MHMRKTLVIIFAVAILGGLSFYITSNKSKNNVTASPQSDTSQTSGTSVSSKPVKSRGNSSSSSYEDGTYTGTVADTPYGPVQIAAVISGGKIADVNFLEMPTDEQRSRMITSESKPMLKQAAITAQSASIDFVSGATSTSYGYQESLQAALDKAVQS
jgi:uncharacterized protein with FMN-binding domain